jgi:hypothetical protein
MVDHRTFVTTSGMPSRTSQTTKTASRMPRFFRSIRTPSQNFAAGHARPPETVTRRYAGVTDAGTARG